MASRANAEPNHVRQVRELDKKIEHMQTLAARVLDQMTTNGIAELVREMRDEKKKLHPDPE